MMEITRQLSGIATKLDSDQKLFELYAWAKTQPGIAVTIGAKVDGSTHIQCEGTEVATVYPEMNDWLVFDGEKFTIYKDDSAFTEAGYEIP